MLKMQINNLKRNIELLRAKAAALPRLPGVYIMHGSKNEVIYVGKSRSLRDRVSQYFHGVHDTKTDRMASSVYDFEFIVCTTEMEALSLENRLIKHHTPKYNIKLKDAKSYPYIRVNYKTDYPRITMTRTRLADGALYFGPYSSTSTVFSVITALERTLGIPSCKRNFPADIGKDRPCINYQIGRCVGLCTGNVSKDEYKKIIDTGIEILKGGITEAVKNLTEDMYKYSEELEFEKAAKCRDTIESLKKLGEKQTAVTSPDVECDVFGYCPANMTASGHDSLSVFFIRSGYIADRDHFLIDDDVIFNSPSEDGESDLVNMITRIYSDREYAPREILLSFDISENDRTLIGDYLSSKFEKKINIKTPKRGASKSLCELAINDAKRQAENKVTKRKATEKMLYRLADILCLEVYPERIESFDISNMGNDNITAGMIVALDGKFAKNEYRTYSIKSLNAPDDYAAMREAVLRRLARSKNPSDDGKTIPYPDLLLLDGGASHVSIISDALKENGYNVPVFGMVKDDHHKTRTLVSVDGEIDISRLTDVFKFIYSLQEEVHRYTIKRMSNAKRKSVKHSSLEKISGIGPAKAKKLLNHFKTLTALKNSTTNEIASVDGISKTDADRIYEYFRQERK